MDATTNLFTIQVFVTTAGENLHFQHFVVPALRFGSSCFLGRTFIHVRATALSWHGGSFCIAHKWFKLFVLVFY